MYSNFNTGNVNPGYLLVLDKETGSLKWSYKLSNHLFSTSACIIDANGHVFHSVLNTVNQ
ncbi:PQQ-binding-like beta-propeller repeat protein [Pseudarcicella hirudinis]|uniref:PQQ-binding-like beta-propeller repeat protein n=1 Tax=Pseudarcicella hirudinis TaxID=1079859 RepID=UPI000B84F642